LASVDAAPGSGHPSTVAATAGATAASNHATVLIFWCHRIMALTV
jgi:molybdenum cofactor biosynthesis enzyme